MKKSIFLSILCIILLLTITGCGGEKNYGKIKDESGNITEITAKEMIDVHNSNETKFESLYKGKTIDVTDKVEKVMKQGNVTCLFLKNNWVIATHDLTNEFIDFTATLDTGDTVNITGKIYDVGGYCGYQSVIEINYTSNSTMRIVK